MDAHASDVDDPPALRTLFSDRSWPEASLASPSVLEGKTVLVSGAGGSLGRVLIRSLRRLPVRRVLALDASEHVLVRLRSQLGDEPTAAPPVECVLGDLRRTADRRRALAAGPDVVVHAAAYKHVPFLEDRPIAAVENNLLATVDWARACREAGVDRFAFISTDKVVAPTSVMGRTKFWAERWLHRCREQTTASDGAPTHTTVRLCNLFGSRGSVVPRFLRHLRANEPLPLTHPDMHRWFMTRADASTTTLSALTAPPGTYVPAARVYVSIVTLARRLVQWGRSSAPPGEWIRWVGRRPGERLHEALCGADETLRRLEGATLSRVEAPPPSPSLRKRIAALRTACAEDETDAVRSLLQADTDAVAPSPASARSEPGP